MAELKWTEWSPCEGQLVDLWPRDDMKPHPASQGGWHIVTGIDPGDKDYRGRPAEAPHVLQLELSGTPHKNVPAAFALLLPSRQQLEARGLSAAQAFDLHCAGRDDDGPGRIWQLAAGYLSWHNRGPVYWLWSGCDSAAYVDPRRHADTQQDLQKYGAVLAWLALQQEAHDAT